MSTNREYFVRLNGYGCIDANDEYSNKVHVVCFTSVPYKLKEDIEYDGYQLDNGYLIWNAINKSPRRHKLRFLTKPKITRQRFFEIFRHWLWSTKGWNCKVVMFWVHHLCWKNVTNDDDI